MRITPGQSHAQVNIAARAQAGRPAAGASPRDDAGDAKVHGFPSPRGHAHGLVRKIANGTFNGSAVAQLRHRTAFATQIEAAAQRNVLEQAPDTVQSFVDDVTQTVNEQAADLELGDEQAAAVQDALGVFQSTADDAAGQFVAPESDAVGDRDALYSVIQSAYDDLHTALDTLLNPTPAAADTETPETAAITAINPIVDPPPVESPENTAEIAETGETAPVGEPTDTTETGTIATTAEIEAQTQPTSASAPTSTIEATEEADPVAAFFTALQTTFDTAFSDLQTSIQQSGEIAPMPEPRHTRGGAYDKFLAAYQATQTPDPAAEDATSPAVESTFDILA